MLEESLRKIHQQPVRTELDFTPTKEEVKAAIAKLKYHKAPGVDGIPAEVYKLGGDTLLEELTELFDMCWNNGTLPQDLRDAVIVSLYKNKGRNRTVQTTEVSHYYPLLGRYWLESS